MAGNPAKALAARISSALKSSGKPELVEPMTKYFKGVLKFYGIKAPDVRAVVAEFKPDILSLKSVDDSFVLAEELLTSEYAEDKSAATSVLKFNLKQLSSVHMPKIEKIFDANLVYDWGTCDSVSGGVIAEIMKKDAKVAQFLRSWKDASTNPWKQRAACVSFVKLARHGKFNDDILDICSTTVQNPYRFVQLGTGWVLRELWLADPKITVNFIKSNYKHFSREGLRYALEKMDAKTKQLLSDEHLEHVPGKKSSTKAPKKESHKDDHLDDQEDADGMEDEIPTPKSRPKSKRKDPEPVEAPKRKRQDRKAK